MCIKLGWENRWFLLLFFSLQFDIVDFVRKIIYMECYDSVQHDPLRCLFHSLYGIIVRVFFILIRGKVYEDFQSFE